MSSTLREPTPAWLAGTTALYWVGNVLWSVLASASVPVIGAWTGELFPTQSDAESWLGEEWRPLLAAGVSRVWLLEHDRVVYGPMSLDPQD